MPVNIVPFRLRKRKDDDLREALRIIPDHVEVSDLVREALRMYFFNAPTPLRDAYVQVPEQKLIKAPPQQITIPQFKQVTTPTSVSTDLDDKLNKSLGFF
jgi:hypothetical protein